MRNARLDEAQAGIKIVGKNINKFVMDKGSLACCSPWGHKESGMTE